MRLSGEEFHCVSIESTSCDPMLDPYNPLTHIPICRHAKKCPLRNMTAWHSPSLSLMQNNPSTLWVRQMKKIKNVLCTHTKQLTPNRNKGRYPVFPEPTPPRIAQHGREVVIALITARITLLYVARKHPSLFSLRLPFRRGAEVAEGLSPSFCPCAARLVKTSYVHRCFGLMLPDPAPGLILSCRSMWRRVYCANMYGHTLIT